ncbi:hypothetical protein AM228_26235 [Planktothricoides sp. SR001]|nr:hypothetical protein AM228_26235 [Planktothricoides sp. SR001]
MFNRKMPIKQHYLFLTGIIIFSTALRFTGLEAKALWLDEILTTLFSLGHSFNHVPLNQIFSLAELPNIFTFNPQATCPQIAETIARESTHPPVFFCGIHWWLGRMKPTANLQDIVWQVRSLPALFGVATVGAIYLLGRVAFSPKTGLIAAALIAVSPFAVYLSQEARHYTLPLLFITLSLISLIKIQHNFQQERKVKTKTWISWVICNTIGLYTHYFFILVLAAEIGAILLWQIWQSIPTIQPTPTSPKPGEFGWHKKTHNYCQIIPIIRKIIPSLWHFSFCILPLILFLPWLSNLLQHSSRQETEWFKPFEPSWLDHIVPIYQIIMGWVLMAIALPVENQPLWIAIPCGLGMLGFAIALGRYLWQKIPCLCQNFRCQTSTFTLGMYTILILGEFLSIVYILGQDITSAIRYHFIYYPSICVLLAACFSPELVNHTHPLLADNNNLGKDSMRAISQTLAPRLCFNKNQLKISIKNRIFFDKIVILIGICSSVFVISGFAFQKPYHPELVAKQLNLEPEKPLMVIVGYENFQEVALGLGFAWELYHQRTQNLAQATHWLFIDRREGYHSIWPTLPGLEHPVTDESEGSFESFKSLNLWVVAPGLRQKEYPNNLSFSAFNDCIIDPNQYYRIGIPYQLYRCAAEPQPGGKMG